MRARFYSRTPLILSTFQRGITTTAKRMRLQRRTARTPASPKCFNTRMAPAHMKMKMLPRWRRLQRCQEKKRALVKIQNKTSFWLCLCGISFRPLNKCKT